MNHKYYYSFSNDIKEGPILLMNLMDRPQYLSSKRKCIYEKNRKINFSQRFKTYTNQHQNCVFNFPRRRSNN